MDPFAPPPKPKTALGWHRVLSPTANVKVSPIARGGISIGNAWSKLFGKSDNPFALLDAYFELEGNFELGGNFIDTSNTYNSEESEQLIGEWMEKC
jgi:aryl-alcohol dehydrogenase-like predicted oxidoreductase